MMTAAVTRIWGCGGLSFVGKLTVEFAPVVFFDFVELSRFIKPAEECLTYRDQLFYWFKHSGQLDRIPEFVSRSPQMEELAKACETGSFTPEKKLEYERLMLNELDKINMVRQAEKRALAKGREEGREEERMSVAKSLLAMGGRTDDCRGDETVRGRDLGIVKPWVAKRRRPGCPSDFGLQ